MARKSRSSVDHMHLHNAVRSLAANIRFAAAERPVRSIAVTSSVPGEGKTTICTQLARAFAAGGKSVLLVECDVRNRALSSVLNLRARAGLHSVLSGQAQLADAVLATSVRGVYFLDAEAHISNLDVLLDSERCARVLEQACQSFDYVLFDTPALSTCVDAAVLASVVDGTLLVVGQDVVRADALTAAREQLKKAHARVLGAVMNYCTPGHRDRAEGHMAVASEDDAAPAAMPVRPLKKAARHVPAQAPEGGTPVAAPRATVPVSPSSTAQFMASVSEAPAAKVARKRL